jgi:hypothetical protein
MRMSRNFAADLAARVFARSLGLRPPASPPQMEMRRAVTLYSEEQRLSPSGSGAQSRVFKPAEARVRGETPEPVKLL